MKRKPLIFLSRCRLRPALLLLALLPFLPIFALGDQEGDFQFEIAGAGAEITAYLGPGGAVVIPDQLGGQPVTSIGNAAFYSVLSLTSVTIPNSVTNIGRAAFFYCTGLTSVTVPNSVTKIDASAFGDCTGLRDRSLQHRHRLAFAAVSPPTTRQLRIYRYEK